MALIDQVRTVCQRLAGLGWRDLLLAVSGGNLDIRQNTSAALRAELTKTLASIDRTVPGFEDFSLAGVRAIEAGVPARSLLYHAMASPGVVRAADGAALGGFPTLAELETVENFVYGVAPPTIQDLRQRAGAGNAIAMVVFAYEYRPAAETVHRKQADVCFSRTGVARVGTKPAAYDAAQRGFDPFVADRPNELRVLPARYGAYIAVQLRGSRNDFGPMRFQDGSGPSDDDGTGSGGSDANRDFWVPLHKLFAGSECIAGLNLEVSFSSHHVNEKLRRIHREFQRVGLDGGWREPQISSPPFFFTDGLAELSNEADFGPGLVVPVPHAALVEEAKLNGELVTFKVPAAGSAGGNVPSTLSSSLELRTGGNARLAPEYVHVRSRVLNNGQRRDLNELANPEGFIRDGDFQALHYVDFSADGWVEVQCPQLDALITRRVAAYSLVAAPDFFPNCDQRELLEWTETALPAALREELWSTPPEALSDDRIPPNVQLAGSGFRGEDVTVTAVVSLKSAGAAPQASIKTAPTSRHCCLPDAAAGVFAPGWDVARSRQLPNGPIHLATFGLGSPFPEDAKLCAALSTFWPAVAPDAARQFEDPNQTVVPLTDEEIGQTGNLPWDGIPGPKEVTVGTQRRVQFIDIAHSDYVRSALDGKFSIHLTGRVDAEEYQRRALHMARVYKAMEDEGLPEPRGEWAVLSFKPVAVNDADLLAAAAEAGVSTPAGPVYRFHLFRRGAVTRVPQDVRLVRMQMADEVFFFTGSPRILIKHGNSPWKQA